MTDGTRLICYLILKKNTRIFEEKNWFRWRRTVVEGVGRADGLNEAMAQLDVGALDAATGELAGPGKVGQQRVAATDDDVDRPAIGRLPADRRSTAKAVPPIGRNQHGHSAPLQAATRGSVQLLRRRRHQILTKEKINQFIIMQSTFSILLFHLNNQNEE